MKITTLLAICALGIATTGFCVDSPTSPLETTGLAEELLTLLQVEKGMNESLAQVTKMQDQLLQGLSPEMKAKQQEAMKATMGEGFMSWSSIRPMFVEIYASTFTAEELQGMIAFFKTPIGQKWIEKQPEVQSKSMQKMQELVMQAQPKIMETLMKIYQNKAPAGKE